MLSPRNEHRILGAAIGGIFGTLQQSSANRANFRNTQTTNKFNMLEAQKQRDWQEKMVDESREYNSPEAMIARGLNPFMSGSAAYRDWCWLRFFTFWCPGFCCQSYSVSGFSS